MGRGASCPTAADKFNAPVLADFRAATYQDHADLPGALDVRPAAGLQIGGFAFDSAQDALAVDFLSHPAFRKFIRRAVADLHRAIFEDNRIRAALVAF